MSPGGHLLTTAVACAGVAAATGSWTVTAAVAAGGFFIDLDHAADYVLFEGRRAPRDLRPDAFLRFYLEGRLRRAVLVLHSYELFALLGALAWLFESPLLAGYLVGAVMHLGLDLAFNGELTPRSIFAFYSFVHRARHRFDAAALLGPMEIGAPTGFWHGFFLGPRRAPTPRRALSRPLVPT